MNFIEPSIHAVDRAVQRLGLSRPEARRRLRQAYRDSFKVPRRHGRTLGRRTSSRPKRKRKGQPEIRVTATLVLVCKGGTIITCWPLSEAEQATVMWWVLSGCWEA